MPTNPLRPLRHEFLMELRANLDMQIIGDTPNGHRRVYPILGGSVQGPGIEGDVLPGGSDALLVRPDGSGLLDVRLTVKTSDDALIYITYRGILNPIPALEARLMAGETVPASDYYFRTAPLFETAAGRYAYLNQVLAVGVGEVGLGWVAYSVYQIL